MRELALAFLFLGAASPTLPSPKQSKSRPLESIIYEMLFCNSFLLTFIQNDGGGGCICACRCARVWTYSPVLREKKWRPRKLQSITTDLSAWKVTSRSLTPREGPLAWPGGRQSVSADADTPRTNPSAMARIRPVDLPITYLPGSCLLQSRNFSGCRRRLANCFKW